MDLIKGSLGSLVTLPPASRVLNRLNMIPKHETGRSTNDTLMIGIKTEPRLRSPCSSLSEMSGSYPSAATSTGGPPPSKRPRHESGSWLLSPGQTSVDSLSPPPVLSNGQQYTPTVTTNGFSPLSAGSYDPYSPNGKMSQDDLSPTNSLNGYSIDCGDGKKRKGPTPRQQEELCLVCGDRASGYHYNALTCEGCKGFFRRSITKNAVYQCKYGRTCEIDMYMRRKCQECRLKKCLAVGMRPECVVPEIQCAVKREAKKQKDKDKPNSTTNGSPDDKDLQDANKLSPMRQPSSSSSNDIRPCPIILCGDTTSSPCILSEMTPISTEQEELITRLVFFQDEFEQPTDPDMRKIPDFVTVNTNASENELKFRHITEMTILTVQLTVEFSKRLPGFDTVLREDQITLLKACSSEVMMLRTARRYDNESDTIMFANNHQYKHNSYNVAGVGDSAEPIFRFCRQMYNLKVDNAEYALITAIVIFSERPLLVEARKVEKIQEIYLEALKAYVKSRRHRAMTLYAKLLSVLTELRTLGNLNSEMCFSLKLKNKKLPPFLAEIWDVAM